MRRLLPAIVIVLLWSPAFAYADGDRVIRDCTDDGQIQGKYSQDEYRDALANMPTDVDEYTDCRDVIRRAQLGTAGGRRSSGTRGGGSDGAPAVSTSDGVPPGADPLAGASPTERAEVDRARSTGDPAGIAGEVVRPGAAPSSSSLGSLPEPLLIGLILLGAASLAVMAARVRSRVLARRSA
jgi:hypothetical protein